jgi:hypothetical protein
MVAGVAALVSATVAFGQAARDAADAVRSAAERESAEQRAREIRAFLDRVLYESEIQSEELIADPSQSSLDWQFNLGAFQEEGSVSADPIDSDGGGASDEDLARAAQNPIADLISLPFQNNINFDVGRFNHTQNVLNIQPVIPFHLNDDWNLITRTIVPVVYQPSLFPGDDYDFGVGDVQFTPFLTPTRTFGGWMIGGGPVIRFPTSTDARLGQRKWALGPSAVALRIDGPWVVGCLFQHAWSLAGAGDRNYSETLLQPFVNYNIPGSGGWYLTTSPIITANWQNDSDNTWLIPIGGGVGKVFRIGDQPINASVQAFYNVETPDVAGPDWTLRFQLQFLFPR